MVFSVSFDICFVYHLVYVLAYIFGNVAICAHVYGCKYLHELCCHVTMLSCGYVIMML